MSQETGPLLDVRHLKQHFPIQRGLLRRTVGQVRAVDGVSFTVHEGKTLGIVGESGCGKSTTGHCIMRGFKPTSGEVIFTDPALGPVDLAKADTKTLRKVRQNIQMVFQDPNASLNPRMNLLELVGEPLIVNRAISGRALKDQVAELLERVGLSSSYLYRYPHAFSGGQRQRIVIARALALNPKLVVADEPVSALDVSIQAQTLNLMHKLQREYALTYLFIAHDLSVIEHFSDTVAVMYVGRIVEMADTRQLYRSPKHPYTEALLSSAPRPNPRLKRARIVLKGEVPSAASPPSGCHFHPRCRYAEPICSREEPQLEEIAPGHHVRCHFAKTLALNGVDAS